MCVMYSPDEFERLEAWFDGFLWPDRDPRQRRRRARILEEATRLFVRHGYRKTAIDEVARAAGVAKGTVYLYYRTKAELLFHAIALEKRSLLDRFAPLLDTRLNSEHRLTELIRTGLLAMHDSPLLGRLVGGDRELAHALTEVDASLLAQVDDWRRTFLADLLDQASGGGLARSDLAARTDVLIDLVEAIALSPRRLSGHQVPEEYAGMLAKTLVNGILHEAPGTDAAIRMDDSDQPHQPARVDQTRTGER